MCIITSVCFLLLSVSQTLISKIPLIQKTVNYTDQAEFADNKCLRNLFLTGERDALWKSSSIPGTLLSISLLSSCQVWQRFGKVCQSFKALIYCPSQHAHLITFQLATTGLMFTQGAEEEKLHTSSLSGPLSLSLSPSASRLQCHLCTVAPEGYLRRQPDPH